jgi:hypothetical protein
VLVQVAAALLLVVQLVRRGEWVLLVLQGLLVVVEGERKMWVDHNKEPLSLTRLSPVLRDRPLYIQVLATETHASRTLRSPTLTHMLLS